MHSSVFMTALCAASALAKPIMRKDLVEETVVVTDIVYTTITEGAEPEATAAPVQVLAAGDYSTPEAAAAPSVSFTTVIIVPTVAAAAAPSSSAPAAVFVVTSEAVAPVATSTAAAAPAASSAAASVVAPASSSTDSGLTAYQSTAVIHHNKHRANHSAPDVAWSASLASSAATLAAGCVFEHNMDINGGGYGQNIASITASDLDLIDINSVIASTITNQWYYGEANNWNFGDKSSGMDTDAKQWLHFTQVVWKASTTIGCATQYCKAGTMSATDASYFTVCNYGPQGNVSPLFAENVLAPIGLPAFTASVTHKTS
ncbi:CAP domain-containing protein [Tricladium varicosporioides]|nr:CAP domain-containing protein [Hymenoscyphus varicosporioides]